MNYLAHVMLGEQTDDGVLGSLLGDFVKGRVGARYPHAVARGIRLHRRLDTFTDTHPATLASRRRFTGERRRVAGIIVDVCYDHFLCREWERYSSEPLESFTRRVYAVLERRRESLPDRLRGLAPRMADEDWLGSYAVLGRVGRVLDGISRRLREPHRLAGSLPDIETHYRGLARDFDAFFPEAVAHARRLRDEAEADIARKRAPTGA